MKHATQAQFGRSIEVVPLSDQSSMTDKWQALNALTEAAQIYEISHRTLGVLKALMSFLPGRLISPIPGQAIVFPSNRTLSHRLNGMPDSTLRRHLARLVSLGIVSRCDSPNRKRYRRGVGEAGISFGFDLSPIARQGDHLRQNADQARKTRTELDAKRAQLAALRQRLLEQGDDHLADDAHRALRRKPDMAQLTELCRLIEARLEEVSTHQLSSTDAQNERHIQARDNYNPDSDTRTERGQGQKKDPKSQIALRDVLKACPTIDTYFPGEIYNWSQLCRCGERLAIMLGIDPPVFVEACGVMGAERASITVICILERLRDIENPGGYLRKISQMAQAGRLDIGLVLDAAKRKLSADNQNNHCKSMR